MAVLDRDAIMAALFDRLKDSLAGSVRTFTRRLEHYHNATLQPALVLLSSRHAANTELGMPPIWRMTAEVWIYSETTDSDGSPETKLNALVGQLEAALERQPEDPRVAWGGDETGTTLGGLCSSCVVTSVELEQGAESGQAEAIITLSITAPAG